MEVQTVVGAVTTVLAVVIFVGIVVWAFGSGRKKSFDQAASAPFALPDETEETTSSNNSVKQDI